MASFSAVHVTAECLSMETIRGILRSFHAATFRGQMHYTKAATFRSMLRAGEP